MRGGARDAELLKHARNVEVLVGVASGSATTALGHRAQSMILMKFYEIS